MLDFPFQLEKRAFVANQKARNPGWWNTGFPGPHSVPDFWLWNLFLNPTASGKPIFGWAARGPPANPPTVLLRLWPSGEDGAEAVFPRSVQLSRWLWWHCDWPLHWIWQWPETCQLKQLSWFFVYCHYYLSRGCWRGDPLVYYSRVWQVPAVVPCSPSACHPLGMGRGVVQVCWVWVAACSTSGSAPSPLEPSAVSDHQPCAQTGSTWWPAWVPQRDPRWQLKILKVEEPKALLRSQKHESTFWKRLISWGNEGHQKHP